MLPAAIHNYSPKRLWEDYHYILAMADFHGHTEPAAMWGWMAFTYFPHKLNLGLDHKLYRALFCLWLH